jgi:hypothetical protein
MIALGLLPLLSFLLPCERWWRPLFLYLAVLILLGLLVAVRILQSVLHKACWKSRGDRKGTGSEGHPPSRSIKVPPHTYKRPDPMLYSQTYLLSKGVAVTWDNPDIQLFDGVAPVPSHGLRPQTSYRVVARIWNGSNDAPAVNVLVKFYLVSFGAGGRREHLGDRYVDVPVKGSPLGPAFVEMPWLTPTAGHYCIQVELVWIDDANPLNNIGQENVQVGKLNSPRAKFSFHVHNTTARTRTLALRADAYQLPSRKPCAPLRHGTRQQGSVTKDPYARHRLAMHPIPPGWTVEFVAGDTLTLQPGEGQDVAVVVTSTDDFAGRQPINVNVWDVEQLFGGVTLYVHS